MKMFQQIISGSKITAHLLFCTIVLILFYSGTWSLNVAGFTFGDVPLVFARFLFFLLCLYTGRWLCQRWYLTNKLLPFLLFALLACFLIALSWWVVIRYLFGHEYAGFIEVVISVMPFFTIGIITGMLLKLIRATTRKQLQEAQIATGQKESELNLLQSQLSPHFLFNTLNNLYGFSIEEDKRLPDLLLKLSDLLRYSLYDTRKIFVPLKEELGYIRNYIEFEKLRISDRLLLKEDIEEINKGIMIAPMLLIVFIENAFKHAKNTLEERIYVDINLKVSGDFILFSVKNSSGKTNVIHNILNERSGLGLANTIKRLELLYDKNYTLHQFVENDLYTVQLNLKIKDR